MRARDRAGKNERSGVSPSIALRRRTSVLFAYSILVYVL